MIRRLAMAAGLACCLWTGPAEAYDPRLPLLASETGAEKKVAQFERSCAERPDLKAALAAAKDVAIRDRIHVSLLSLPAYAEAVAGYEATGDNAQAWRELLKSDAAQFHFLRAHATYFLGRSLLAQDDLAGAAEALEQVRGRLRDGTAWTDEATLYLGYIYARLPELGGHATANQARAKTTLSSLVDQEGKPALYAGVPERVRQGAGWMLRELDGEGRGPLLELAKRMTTIERMIRRAATGEGTQVRQKKVMDEIDRLIALMRQREQSGGS